MAVSQPTARELLEHHYAYELTMLMDTNAPIGTGEDIIIENALIESFCIHARALVEFFTKDRGAKSYAESTFKPFADSGRVKQLNRLLNTQIAHLIFDGRTSNPDKKISMTEREELVSLLITKSLEFKKVLRLEYRGVQVPVILQTAAASSASKLPSDEVKLLCSSKPSATNAISGTTSSTKINSSFIG
jgi:hypothetical protein